MRFVRTFLRPALFGAFLLAAACGGSDSSINPTAPSTPTSPTTPASPTLPPLPPPSSPTGNCARPALPSTVSASVNGTSYVADHHIAWTFAPLGADIYSFTLQSSECTGASQLEFLVITAQTTGDGPRTVSSNFVVSGILDSDASTGRSVQWDSARSGGSATVTFTKLTASEAAGTFSFVAPADSSSGASGTKSVTNGRFDLKVPLGATTTR